MYSMMLSIGNLHIGMGRSAPTMVISSILPGLIAETEA